MNRRAGAAGAALAAAALLLAACGKSDADPGPGGVTVGEARALDQAAEMLDKQRLAPPPTPTPTGESPTSSASNVQTVRRQHQPTMTTTRGAVPNHISCDPASAGSW